MYKDQWIFFFTWVVIICGSLLWYFWDSKLIVSIRYDTDFDKVYSDPKPHDCEWGTAPLGQKHCDYQSVITKNSDGRVFLRWSKIVS